MCSQILLQHQELVFIDVHKVLHSVLYIICFLGFSHSYTLNVRNQEKFVGNIQNIKVANHRLVYLYRIRNTEMIFTLP